MIRTTSISAHRSFTGEGTWLDRYCTTMGRTRFPMSYHLLCGIMTLTAIVGRRCRLEIPDVSLYPAMSVILIGTSGVGKSQAMRHAGYILKRVADTNDFPFFYDKELSGTSSGLINRWQKWQREEGENHPLEGAYICDELGAFVSPITGKEDNDKFLMQMLSHDDYSQTTASRGVRHLREPTINFGFCTTIIDLRKQMDADSFADGFMHRFLIAFERVRPDTDAGDVPEQEKQWLADEATSIREDAPRVMDIPRETWVHIHALKNLAEEHHYSVASLAGFWNRFPGYCAKLGTARAISAGRFTLEVDDVRAAANLVENFLYPPLEELVKELKANTRMRTLYDISDDLLTAGPEGIKDADMKVRTGVTTVRGQNDFLGAMRACGLAYQGTTPTTTGKWYRFEEWASPNGATPHPDDD